MADTSIIKFQLKTDTKQKKVNERERGMSF